ncbi:MAG: HAD family hydrolase [Deinococcus sp.]|nr:HAD family hydrolase [Deinococcus sp.]
MIRAVCFDFDGTLAEFTGDFDKLGLETYRRLGLETTSPCGLSEADPGPLFQSYWRHQRADGAVTVESALRNALEELSLVPPYDVRQAASEMVAGYASQVELLPGALEVLGYFSRLPMALITNGPSDIQRAAVQSVGIEGHFQAILVSGDEEVASRKPNARIFRLACERLGAEPANVLMIGDNLEADIQGAIAAGMPALHIQGARP